MKSLENKTKSQLIEMTNESDSVYFSAVTEYCARLSCGGVIELLKEISLGNVRNGIAIVRPPGHHAIHNQPMGFCFYNNVAVAVKKMKKTYNVKKVLILDWDVHHGNGVQDAFYSDPEVLYISLHRYGEGFYPSSGDLGEVGEGAGVGRNVNIPFTALGMGDNDYLYAFHKVVMPIAMEFNPDLVVVAAGFDAAMGDPIGEFVVTPAGYANMAHLLKGLAQGRMAVCLEGGYDLAAISQSSLSVSNVLLGARPETTGPISPSKQCVKDIHRVIAVQAKYWECLKRYNNSIV
ncbi:Histone deacetylase hda1 [Entomophthora muscae]|uniref:Histone deacetylase hda1 n=1 Tax=Entomophthora muscae TaxID=34485 RepID=A0ACC2TDK7_9FUNG|nr:Histone deacetylase hda1 [Entomophthora muscae]